jgi:tetratricopeptide (TPR) repeat protein
MKYYHIKNLSYLLILMFAASVAQASGWQKAVKCADKKVQKKYYASAADMYERILAHGCSKDSTWRDSSYSVKVKLADCYMKTGNTIKAESNYAEVVKAGKADPLATFNYARALQANGKYAEAKDQFDKVADNAPIKGKMAKGFGEVSEKAIHAEYKNSFNIERMSFNTTATEYAPAYYKKGLAYTSNKAERGQGSQRIMWNKEPFTDLYTVQEDGKGDLNVTDKLPNTMLHLMRFSSPEIMQSAKSMISFRYSPVLSMVQSGARLSC